MHGTTLTGDGLAEIDDALLRLRRLWSLSRHRVVDDAGAPVEISSLIVVEACARGAERASSGADGPGADGAGAGGAADEVTVSDVARLADVTASTASRLVDRAASGGWVRRTPSSTSARRTAVVVTPAGAALRERAVRSRRAWLARQLDGWSPGDARELGRLLSRFAEGLDDPAAGGPGPPTDPGPSDPQGPPA